MEANEVDTAQIEAEQRKWRELFYAHETQALAREIFARAVSANIETLKTAEYHARLAYKAAESFQVVTKERAK